MGTPPAIPIRDPITLIGQSDPDTIRDQLQDQERKRKALLVLLRAAGAAARNRDRQAGKAVPRGC